MLDQELDEDVLKADLLDCLLEALVGQHHVVAVAVDEQNVFVFDFSVSPRDAGRP